MILAATGHRPDKLGGYSDEVLARLQRLAAAWIVDYHPTQVISGMALGWDTAVALAAIEHGYPLVAAVPFVGQESIWPKAAQERYRKILAHAEVRIISPGGFSVGKMQYRNEWMVNRCDRLVALWDGSSGGTANCVFYADRKKKPYDNLWPRWIEEKVT